MTHDLKSHKIMEIDQNEMLEAVRYVITFFLYERIVMKLSLFFDTNILNFAYVVHRSEKG